MNILLQVALGGAIGAVLRFLTVQGAVRLFGGGVPVGTFAVNVVGSFVMGLVTVWLVERELKKRSEYFAKLRSATKRQ